MVRGIIFDCFGVLYVDMSRVYFSKFPKLHDELYDLNKMSDHGFISRQEYIMSVAKLTGISEEETTQAFRNEYVANKELIEYIKENIKPHYKVGMISNIGRGWIQDFFDEHQLHDLFDVVTLSGEEGIAKPNPLIFERTALKLGLSPDECLMIDDRPENVEGARATGMKGLEYTSNDVLYQEFQKLAEARQ
jgi:HAD superfamily hydrolase (TIGR01509 family)